MRLNERKAFDITNHFIREFLKLSDESDCASVFFEVT